MRTGAEQCTGRPSQTRSIASGIRSNYLACALLGYAKDLGRELDEAEARIWDANRAAGVAPESIEAGEPEGAETGA